MLLYSAFSRAASLTVYFAVDLFVWWRKCHRGRTSRNYLAAARCDGCVDHRLCNAFYVRSTFCSQAEGKQSLEKMACVKLLTYFYIPEMPSAKTVWILRGTNIILYIFMLLTNKLQTFNHLWRVLRHYEMFFFPCYSFQELAR